MIFDVQLPYNTWSCPAHRCWSSLVGVLVGSLCLWWSACAWGQQQVANVDAIRFSGTEDRTRVWIELTQAVDYDVFQLQNPPRLVVDFDPVQWSIDRGNLVTQQGVVSAVRFGQHSDQKSRLVLDLTRSVESSFSFFEAPHANANHRLVLELIDPSQNTNSAGGVSLADEVARQDGTDVPMPMVRPTSIPIKPLHLVRTFTVVIDPGHGGKDPGAIGESGLIEKNVTLAAARELAHALRATGRYNVELTRDSDTFIPVHVRPQIGRAKSGDLFISLHADSAGSASVSGASVYTLSETASDRESAALAKRENASDEVAGVEITEYPAAIRDILVDLTMRRTVNESSRFADIVVDALRRDWRVLPSRPHRSAGFAVLFSADMPSVLVEMGYLTNANDVRMLASRTQRAKFVKAMVQATNRYFESLGGTF